MKSFLPPIGGILLSTFVCMAAVEKPAGARLWVPLTITERAGVQRFDEPVTSGVPLPEGLIDDPGRLVLLAPDGRAVPAQFTVANRWYPGNSIKWVLVDFQANAQPNEKITYYLTDVGSNPSPKTPVTVKLEGDTAIVTTGKLKLVVKRVGFNLFDEVWVDESGTEKYDASTQVVRSHGAGISLMHGGAVLPDYKHFTPANDPDVTLEVEEAGPMRAGVRLTGKHISTNNMPGDNHLLDFDCRIHAYAGSTFVKVVYSMMCRQGKSIADGVPLDRAWFSIPLVLDPAQRTWAVGLPNGKAIHPGTDVAKELPPWRPDADVPGLEVKKYHQAGLEDCWVHADRSDRIGYYGDFFRKRLPLVARGKYDKGGCLTAGGLDLGDETSGVAAGIQWFWQTWPRAIKADPAAIIVMPHANFQSRPPLMTTANGPRAHWYPGMSQTSTTMFLFRGRRDIARIVGAYAGLNRPLRLIAPPSWYCEQTQVFGRLASSTPELYDEETWKIVAAYDERLRKTLEHILKFRDYNFGDYDHYGMFNFGDVIDFIHGNRSNPGDRNVTWDNCYYDYPHALFLQFARTGDELFLDTAIEAQHHLMDMDMSAGIPATT
ncbi:MAG: exo-rhamnogalacturonan lyase family protein [Kiritimatiellia bacterium]